MKKIGTNTIETSRCTLRRVTPEDALMMYENWAKCEEVFRYFPLNPATDFAKYKEKVQCWASNYESDTYFHWVIEWKEDGQVIGTMNLNEIDEIAGLAKTCYMLAPKYWGQGIMTEVLQAVLEYAFTRIELQQVQADVFVGNVASEAVLQKCGMKQVGIEPQKFTKDGASVDAIIYAVEND